MKLKKALDNFRTLKEEILKDGKIDSSEVKILLDFLQPYTMTYSVRFTKLRNALYESLSSGVEGKQEYLIGLIEEAESFLMFEEKMERFLGVAVITSFALILLYAIL